MGRGWGEGQMQGQVERLGVTPATDDLNLFFLPARPFPEIPRGSCPHLLPVLVLTCPGSILASPRPPWAFLVSVQESAQVLPPPGSPPAALTFPAVEFTLSFPQRLRPTDSAAYLLNVSSPLPHETGVLPMNPSAHGLFCSGMNLKDPRGVQSQP